MKPTARLAELGRDLVRELGREREDLAAPIAQRWYRDDERADPEEQILAEPTALHLGLEVAVRRAHQAHVDRAAR